MSLESVRAYFKEHAPDITVMVTATSSAMGASSGTVMMSGPLPAAAPVRSGRLLLAALACVAAVVSYRIPATDAISCSIPVDHASEEEVQRVADVIRRESADLAATLRSEGIR